MDTITSTPETAPVAPSALMAGLLKIAESKQVSAEELTNKSVRIDFIEASVTVELDTDNGLLLFNCPSKNQKSPEVLSTSSPIEAATAEKDLERIYEYAEMLALIQGVTATDWPQQN